MNGLCSETAGCARGADGCTGGTGGSIGGKIGSGRGAGGPPSAKSIYVIDCVIRNKFNSIPNNN